MWKKMLALLVTSVAVLTLFSACKSPSALGTEPGVETVSGAEEDASPFYTDVSETEWYYPYIRAMYDMGVLPESETYSPEGVASGLDLIQGMYRLHLIWDGAASSDGTQTENGEDTALEWANANSITYGVSVTDALTREQACALAVGFASAKELQLVQCAQPVSFLDGDQVSEYAKSAMVACQMSGLMSDMDGCAIPAQTLTRAESAALLYHLNQAAQRPPQADDEYVSLDAEAYLSSYLSFGVPVPESEAVPAEWFDDAVFIGDSVTVRLEMYCSANEGALGGATFLCGTSLSAFNAKADISENSLHPTYNGVKMMLEDSVAACGAKNVYIMLGINGMYTNVDTSTGALADLIEKILEKSPDVNILIETVTPMTSGSNIKSDNMNNEKIDAYNAKMLELCAEHGWYFIDLASQLKDENGDLDPEYCGDPNGMGIHFSNAGAEAWVNYLRTHVPGSLK